MTARRNWTITITITDATEDEANAVQIEIGGAIEDARDSAIWTAPVDVGWGDVEPDPPQHDRRQHG